MIDAYGPTPGETKRGSLTHAELRTWGYERIYLKNKGGDSEEPRKYVDVGKCLRILSGFPSDYFPLRIAQSLEHVIQAATERRHLDVDPARESDQVDAEHESSAIILTARKTACLYQVLKPSLKVPKNVEVLSDRYLYLLPNRNSLDSHKIYLLDDLSRRGEQLSRRKANVATHMSGSSDYGAPRPGDARGPDGSGPGSAEQHDPAYEKLASYALINIKRNDEDARHFRTIGQSDGAGLIRAYSRTFAKHNLPYYTDFAVSRELAVNEEQLRKILELFGPQVFEVTSAVGIDEGQRCYSYDMRAILHKLEIEPKVNALCDSIKLRLFLRSPRTLRTGKQGDEKIFEDRTQIASPDEPVNHKTSETQFRLRIMVKPMFKPLLANAVRELAVEQKLLAHDKVTNLQVGQAYGFFEYLASWQLLNAVWNKLKLHRIIVSHNDDVVDLDSIDKPFAQLVLGPGLFEAAKRMIQSCEDMNHIMDRLEEALGPSGQSSLQRNSFKECGHIVGDDLVQEIDKYVTAATRRGRAKRSAGADDEYNEEFLRLTLRDITVKTRDTVRLMQCPVAPKEMNTGQGFSEELSETDGAFLAALAMDLLTDVGKLVPDQQITDSSKTDVAARIDSVEVESRNAVFREYSHQWVERCFRTGEITAQVEARTISGGALATSASSRVRAEVLNGWELWPWLKVATGCSVSAMGASVDSQAISQSTLAGMGQGESENIFSTPQEVCSALVEVISRLSDWLAAKKTGHSESSEGETPATNARSLCATKLADLETEITRLRTKYYSLPSPVVAQVSNPSDFDYAWDLIRWFHEPLEMTRCREAGCGCLLVLDETKERPDWEKRLQRARELVRDVELWKRSFEIVNAQGTRWTFRAFRRVRRALLALDTVLAFLHVFIQQDWEKASDGQSWGREQQNSYRLIGCAKSVLESYPGCCDDHDGQQSRATLQAHSSALNSVSTRVFSEDVWEDWIGKLAGPPAKLEFAQTEMVANCHSFTALVVAGADILGDLWHAVTHALQPLVFEMADGKGDFFLSHRIRLQKHIERIWEAVVGRLREQLGDAATWRSSGVVDDESSVHLANSPYIAKCLMKPVDFSPFSQGDVLLSAEQVVRREYEYRSGGQWVGLTFDSLADLANSGRLIEVIDWQGDRRYPSYQFTPF